MTKEECEIETSKAIMEMRTNIAKLEKENAELRNTAEFQQSSNMNRYFENKKLKDENTGLKEKVSYLEDNLRVARKELTKAKEIIKDYMIIVKGAHSTVCGVPEENRTIYVLKLNEEAEQFFTDDLYGLL